MTDCSCGFSTPAGSSESLKVRLPADDGVAGVRTAVIADHEIVLVAQ